MTSRRWLVVVVVAAVGLVVAVVIGHNNRASGTATPAAAAAAVTVAPCTVDVHSVEGALVTAVEGFHQLAVANLGPVDVNPDHAAQVDLILERYVTAERRPLMRSYLHAYPAPFVSVSSTVLAWQAVAYTPTVARLRLATADVATTATGEQKASQSVTDATLEFDAVQGFWRLADWKVNATPNVADVTANGRKVPCA